MITFFLFNLNSARKRVCSLSKRFNTYWSPCLCSVKIQLCIKVWWLFDSNHPSNISAGFFVIKYSSSKKKKKKRKFKIREINADSNHKYFGWTLVSNYFVGGFVKKKDSSDIGRWLATINQWSPNPIVIIGISDEQVR